MSLANSYEQYMLELVNAERAKVGAQPLAFDGDLNESAEKHSAWMIATDTFSHTGSGGSTPGQRMAAAGYSFTGSWSWAENIAWASTRSPAGLQDEVQLLHTNLMNSSGHRANILNDGFREIGVGLEVGQYGSYEGAFVTQNFARTGTSNFLTGVAFDDKDGNKRYDVGEALDGITVSAKNTSTGAVFNTTTEPAGGYDLALASGTYSVTFSGNGIASTTQQVTIGSRNVKLDLVDPATANASPTEPAPAPAPEPAPAPTEPQPTEPQPTHVGNNYSNTIHGSSGNDYIVGNGGNDVIYGNAGNDRIEGGSGNDGINGGSGADRINGGTGHDRINGGTGADILTGGSGYDSFYFNSSPSSGVDTITDFSSAYDTIRLENAVFQGLPTGTLSTAAFRVGAAAADATDRIIYNKATGDVLFDADGSGAGEAQLFAKLTPGTAVTNADFAVY